MGRRRDRNEQNHSSDTLHESRETLETIPTKKLKTTPNDEKEIGIDPSLPSQQQQQDKSHQEERPKSKKELRAEKKRSRRLATDPDYAAALREAEIEAKKKEEEREELKRLIREERLETKLRQQKRQNRERNTPGGLASGVEKKSGSESKKSGKKEKAKRKSTDAGGITPDEDVARKVMNEIKYGSSDSSGWTTLLLGVKYKDVVIGKGPMVENKSLVTVKYELTGGKFGSVIDSSKKFQFRLGKGEVIQGWDIGMTGMREGGRRKLVIPPKAGYGSQDIGAGPGGLLNFDVTVLAVQV